MRLFPACPRSRAARGALSTAVLCAVALCACAPATVARRIESVAAISERAAKQGARRCAPEELALARVHLEFARFELARGEARQADRHLTLAEPNAKAAVRLSEAQSCGAPRTAVRPELAAGQASKRALGYASGERSGLLGAAHLKSSRLRGVVGENSDLDRGAP